MHVCVVGMAIWMSTTMCVLTFVNRFSLFRSYTSGQSKKNGRDIERMTEKLAKQPLPFVGRSLKVGKECCLKCCSFSLSLSSFSDFIYPYSIDLCVCVCQPMISVHWVHWLCTRVYLCINMHICIWFALFSSSILLPLTLANTSYSTRLDSDLMPTKEMTVYARIFSSFFHCCCCLLYIWTRQSSRERKPRRQERNRWIFHIY